MIERDRKPWQFSMKRMLAVVTLLCVTLGATVSLFSRSTETLCAVVAITGLSFAIGIFVGGVKGARNVAIVAGVFGSIALFFAIAFLVMIYSNFSN